MIYSGILHPLDFDNMPTVDSDGNVQDQNGVTYASLDPPTMKRRIGRPPHQRNKFQFREKGTVFSVEDTWVDYLFLTSIPVVVHYSGLILNHNNSKFFTARNGSLRQIEEMLTLLIWERGREVEAEALTQ
ncbi:hypothetical protein CK203_080059 [Vitis vinifera]|uniref:Uncharacterized protein n=1 Tax=Vitis vinifera TaxID=29760 RepID=A0A438D9R7_VITVI|nr:hypothetical protein CK203_080059 [Vitis vinifera]